MGKGIFRTKYRYLIQDRLREVISLIQILALNPNDSSSDKTITSFLKISPNSAKSWDEISIEHPEFFVNENGKLFLNYRYYTRMKLSMSDTIELVNTATFLHDKELAQRNKNIFLIPLYIALLTTAFSAFSLIYTTHKTERIIRETIKEEFKDFIKSIPSPSFPKDSSENH